MIISRINEEMFVNVKDIVTKKFGSLVGAHNNNKKMMKEERKKRK